MLRGTTIPIRVASPSGIVIHNYPRLAPLDEGARIQVAREIPLFYYSPFPPEVRLRVLPVFEYRKIFFLFFTLDKATVLSYRELL